nr:MAG TPA: hypothetical protein [Bacteriophage sp.]DAT53763.1 MAG TPA: hypothetical protein [Bacteriophage sp.]
MVRNLPHIRQPSIRVLSCVIISTTKTPNR